MDGIKEVSRRFLLFVNKNRDARREAKKLFDSGPRALITTAPFGGLKPTLQVIGRGDTAIRGPD
jgi:hypothetical protein